jgi:hypothetical protein
VVFVDGRDSAIIRHAQQRYGKGSDSHSASRAAQRFSRRDTDGHSSNGDSRECCTDDSSWRDHQRSHGYINGTSARANDHSRRECRSRHVNGNRRSACADG